MGTAGPPPAALADPREQRLDLAAVQLRQHAEVLPRGRRRRRVGVPHLPPRLGEVETAVCCFRYLPDRVWLMKPEQQDEVQQALQQRIEKSGKAFFPSTILAGRRALRVNVNSYLTEQRHIDDLIELLISEGAAITTSS